jgi:DNA-binding response OmpR family regulator
MMSFRRVLVVDDDPAIREIMAVLLRRDGVEVDIAEDGAKATACLEKNEYAAVVLDLIMPRVDGYGVIEFMKSRGMTTPIVVVSAVSDERPFELDPQLVRVAMQKPIEPRDLRTVVKAILERV